MNSVVNHAQNTQEKIAILATCSLERLETDASNTGLSFAASFHAETAEAVHDFRNILNAVSMLTDAALIESPNTSSTNMFLRHIQSACSDGAELCNRMMDTYITATGAAERVNLSTLIANQAPLLSAYLPQHSDLRFDLVDHQSLVVVSEGAVRQIIMNLVKNAVEALGGKPGSVVISTGFVDFDVLGAEQSGFLGLRNTGQYSFFSVSDTGCGMDDLTRDHLFDRSFTTKSDGHGLGLASVQRLSLHYGGIMQVHSTLGCGTQIHVLFPRS